MVSPLGIPQYMPNAAAAAVSMKYGLHGQMYGVVSACSSGAHAIGSALRMIQYGDADAAVAGGAEATLTRVRGSRASTSMQALSPTGISRPFDARRDGFVMGEGAGVLVLEEADAAEARGATILGEVAGYGSTSDAYHLTAPEPSGGPASRAIELALADAGHHARGRRLRQRPRDLDAAERRRRDRRAEAGARRGAGASGSRSPRPSRRSVTCSAPPARWRRSRRSRRSRTRVIPPTLGYEVPDPELDLDYVPGEARPLVAANGRPPAAISNSFAFGGHNVALVFTAPAHPGTE